MEETQQTLLVECSKCNVTYNAEVVGSFVTKSLDPGGELKFSLCKCPNCWTPILSKQIQFFEIKSFQWGNPEVLYPTIEFHINQSLPEALRKALLEAVNCYKIKSYTATVVMCRRGLDGFCTLKGLKGKSLDKALIHLRDEGVINEQLFDWANQLRLVGNDAAHNIDNIFTETDARDSLDFTIAILDFTYSYKEKFEEFIKRRNVK